MPATYPQIKAYVLETLPLKGFQSVYISGETEVRDWHVGKNYNLSKSEDTRKVPTCPRKRKSNPRRTTVFLVI